MEATIDFPEEDVPSHLPPQENFTRLIDSLSALRRTQHAHRLTFQGARIALVGAPNAGKSSLFNALVGHDRAIVSPIAGTTRDYISTQLTLGPHLVTLIDTAGYVAAPDLSAKREASSTDSPQDYLNTLGVEKTKDQLATADLVLFVFDGTLPAPTLPASFDAARTLLIANKSDASGFKKSPAHLSVSATTGAGLDTLRTALVTRLDALMPQADTLMVSARHAAALDEVLSQLTSAHTLLLQKKDPSLIAHHLHSGLHHLGEILGKFDNEQILDSLFSQFCIGK